MASTSSSSSHSTWGVCSPRSGRWSDDDQDTLEYGPVRAFTKSSKQLAAEFRASRLRALALLCFHFLRQRTPTQQLMSWGYLCDLGQECQGAPWPAQVRQLPQVAPAPAWQPARPTVPTTPSRPSLPSGKKPCLACSSCCFHLSSLKLRMSSSYCALLKIFPESCMLVLLSPEFQPELGKMLLGSATLVDMPVL